MGEQFAFFTFSITNYHHLTAQDEDKGLTSQTPTNREVAVDQTVYYEEKINPILDEISRAVGCGE